MNKLRNIRIGIVGAEGELSPNNLRDYIPHSHTQQSDRIPTPNHLNESVASYRQSLEKKLERLFKEERKQFNESRLSSVLHNQPKPTDFGITAAMPRRDAFTLENMELKIAELEFKYLQRSQSKNKTTKKAKIVEKQETQDVQRQYKSKSTMQPNVGKSDAKLLAEVESLKRQMRSIKNANEELSRKLEGKTEEKKLKKQRCRYLLRCILEKLLAIQYELQRRNKKKVTPTYQQKHNYSPQRRNQFTTF